MQARSNALLVLVLAVVIVIPVMPAGFHSAAHGQMAGCHQHPAKIPSHAPVSYSCCQAGHHAAVPTDSFSLRLGFQGDRVSQVFSPSLPVCSDRRSSYAAFFSPPGSPGLTPLRV